MTNENPRCRLEIGERSDKFIPCKGMKYALTGVEPNRPRKGLNINFMVDKNRKTWTSISYLKTQIRNLPKENTFEVELINFCPWCGAFIQHPKWYESQKNLEKIKGELEYQGGQLENERVIGFIHGYPVGAPSCEFPTCYKVADYKYMELDRDVYFCEEHLPDIAKGLGAAKIKYKKIKTGKIKGLKKNSKPHVKRLCLPRTEELIKDLV